MLTGGCQQLPPAPYAPEQQITVPFFPQTDYHCGPAALASMLHWGGAEADLDGLIDEVWLPGRRGSLAIELDAAARTRGLLVYPLQHPDHLWAELDAGHPVLVLQNLGSPRWPRWHFAVVIGYRDGGQRVLLHTDTRPSHSSHWNRFIRTWARADFTGFVMLPEGKLPATS
ncbi:MAG: peptidase C39, partial [Gammaproteobacteria bacterium HGW-Gammaproteobacteria-14]